MHRGTQPLVQLGEGRVGLLADEHQQATAAFFGHLCGGTTAAGLGRKGAGLPPTLEQAADPGGAHTEQFGKSLAGVRTLVAGTYDPLAKVVGVGFQGKLLSYSFR